MEELISRQKAKDTIDMALDRIDHVPPWVYDNLLNALNEVPSAESSAKDINVPSNDAISRQVVIEAIDKFIPADPMKNDYTQGISVGLAIATRCIEEFSQETDESSQGLVKDLISRQAAIDAICEHGTDLERRGITVLAVANYKQGTVDLLEKLPSVQPERKKGKWIDFSMSITGVPTECCGECGGWSYDMGKNFCPNCGSYNGGKKTNCGCRMEEGDSDEKD